MAASVAAGPMNAGSAGARAPAGGLLSRTIAAMDLRTFDSREQIIATVLVVALSRLVEPPLLWLVGAVLLLATAVGALQLLAQVDPAGETAASRWNRCWCRPLPPSPPPGRSGSSRWASGWSPRSW